MCQILYLFQDVYHCNNDELGNVQEQAMEVESDTPLVGEMTPFSEHDYSKPSAAAKCKKCPKLQLRVNQLRRELRYLKQKHSILEQKYQSLQNLPESDSTKAKNLKNKIVKQELLGKGYFSAAQVSVILRNVKDSKTTVYSRHWTNEDLLKARRLMSIRGAALDYVRQIGFPLPCKRTCQKKFGFLNVVCGLIKPAIIYLRDLIPRLKLSEQLGALSFDEVKIKESAVHDVKLDAFLGPNNYAQVILVRSLLGKWKFPVFFDFDTAVTSRIYFEIIYQLEAISTQILISLSDQGPRNLSLAKELGVSTENVLVPNPFDPSRFIVFSYDFIHVFKNLRNHILDDVFTIGSSRFKFSKEDFNELLRKAECKNMRTSKLKPIHVNAKQSDRQNVQLAKELLSDDVACMFKDYFPCNPKKLQLSNFVALMDKGFNLMTSKSANLNHEDFSKRPFGSSISKQLSCLNRLYRTIDSMKFKKVDSKRKNPKFKQVLCQTGAKICIKAIIKLREILVSLYGITEFPTLNCTQDDLERLFGIIRQLYGYDPTPNAQQFCLRVSTVVVNEILKDSLFNIFDIKAELDKKIEPYFNNGDQILEPFKSYEHPIDDIINRKRKSRCTRPYYRDLRSRARKLEIYYVAGSIAFKFKKEKSLSDVSTEPEKVNPDSFLMTKSLQQGTILQPSRIWLNEVTRMYRLFSEYHPAGSLHKGFGLHENFNKILRSKFSHRSEAILAEFTRIRTNLQIKMINSKCRENKRTVRGMKNLVTTIHS